MLADTADGCVETDVFAEMEMIGALIEGAAVFIATEKVGFQGAVGVAVPFLETGELGGVFRGGGDEAGIGVYPDTDGGSTFFKAGDVPAGKGACSVDGSVGAGSYRSARNIRGEMISSPASKPCSGAECCPNRGLSSMNCEPTASDADDVSMEHMNRNLQPRKMSSPPSEACPFAWLRPEGGDPFPFFIRRECADSKVRSIPEISGSGLP